MTNNGTPTPATVRPTGGSKHVRRYIGKSVMIIFGSGTERLGTLLEVDASGNWGRLDTSHGTVTDDPNVVISVNLRRAEVIG